MRKSRAFDILRDILRQQRASTLVEFALLAPAFLMLLIGALQVGLQIQNYNSVRNLAADGSRFAVVQYQKGVKVDPSVIETWIRSRATGGIYNLNTDRLDVTVTQPLAGSQIAGTKQMDINIGYAAPNYVPQIIGSALNLSYSRPVFLMQ